jgi:hypothetical protein
MYTIASVQYFHKLASKRFRKLKGGVMLKTWGGRSDFRYSGSVVTGTEIVYGRGWKVKVSADQYNALRQYFKGRIVPAGTSRTLHPKDSLGEWLQTNVIKSAIACYVAPILVSEGYASRVGKYDICIFK